MTVTINGTTGINSDGGYAGDGVSFADGTPSNTLVTTSGGNVGVGNTDPGYRIDVLAGDTTAGFGYGLRVRANSTAGAGSIQFTNNPVSVQYGVITGSTTEFKLLADGRPMTFFTGGVERARIDSSGKLLVGTTSSAGLGVTVDPAGTLIQNNNAQASGFVFVSYRRSNTEIGFIDQNGTTAVRYSTTSDYRLKENVQPMTGALAKIAALRPCTYKWKVDGSEGQGFIAHELQEICPDAVTGEKDAVDAEGNPKYQGIDTSFLVATLTAAIQELKAELDTLKTELAVLKGNA